MLVPPLGGTERQILEWSGPSTRISWSPDGRWLATSPVLIRFNRDLGILLISPTDGTQVDWAKLDPTLAGSTQPMLSPDGKRLVYKKPTGEYTSDVYVVGVGADGRPVGKPELVPCVERFGIPPGPRTARSSCSSPVTQAAMAASREPASMAPFNRSGLPDSATRKASQAPPRTGAQEAGFRAGEASTLDIPGERIRSIRSSRGFSPHRRSLTAVQNTRATVAGLLFPRIAAVLAKFGLRTPMARVRNR